MKTRFLSIFHFIKAHKYWTTLAVVILITALFFILRGGEEVVAETITVAKTSVSEEVSVTGRVIPAHEVELSIQSGGKIVSIGARVGDQVRTGQTLIRVDTSDLAVRLERQQATLEKARLALAKQEPNTGDAESDLKKALEDGFNTVADAFLDLPTIISALEDILYDPNHSPYMSDYQVRSVAGDTGMAYKRSAGLKYDAVRRKYDENLKNYKATSRTGSSDAIEILINETFETTRLLADTVKDVHSVIDYLEIQTSSIPDEMIEDQQTLDTYTDDTSSHLLALLNIRNTIKNSRDSIIDETSDTESTRIDIRQAELDIQDTLVQINNRTVRSPIDGVVTSLEAEVGETISQGSPVVSVISANQFEIEANVPEADIAKVKVGAPTYITVDAYGSDIVFEAKIIFVNPAETIVDGVATYRTRAQFTTADERILSGMTASLIIMGERKENVLAVPQRSVITRAGNKFVRIIEGEEIIERTVETGLRGSDGNIEIISGLREGDKVVVFSEAN